MSENQSKFDDDQKSLVAIAIFMAIVGVAFFAYDYGVKVEREIWQKEAVSRGFAEYYRTYKLDNRRQFTSWKWKSDQTGMEEE